MTRPPATLSIDLDDLWAYRRSFGLPADGQARSLLPLAIPRFLAFMRQHDLRGSAFVIGADAEVAAHRRLFRALAAAGHEIGNHSHGHAGDLESWPAERQRADLSRAHTAIEAAAGVAPHGFRGPSFRVSRSLLEAVQSMGYRYDASTFPNALGALARRWQARRADALGTQAALAADTYGSSASARLPLRPYVWALQGGPLVEVPVTTLPGLRIPIHGTYLQHLADLSSVAARAYMVAVLGACKLARVAPHYLLPATDFIGCDDALDCAFLPGMRRPWRAKLALLTTLVDRLRASFVLMPIDAYVAGLGGAADLPTFPADQLGVPR